VNKPIVLYADERLCIGNWRNLLVTDVCGEMDRGSMLRMEEAAQPIYKQFPGHVVSMSLLRHGISVPPAEARQEAQRIMKAQRQAGMRSVVVLEAGGMMASLMQTVLRGLNVLSGEQRLQIVTSLEAGCQAIAPMVRADKPTMPAEVKTALAALRGLYADRFPAARIAQAR
jgi:hypothetical protein